MPDLFMIKIPDEGLTFDEMEKEFVIYMLYFFEGNKSKASRAMGISYPRLDRMIAKHKIVFKTSKIQVMRREK